MVLISESKEFEPYLDELPEVNYSHSLIQHKIKELFQPAQSEVEKAKIAYAFVRDEISHTWDIQGSRVTCIASDVLAYQEGICYAKSNLFAALLRSQGIPTGFCYQRLLLFEKPEQGYCIHALNAVFLKDSGKWIRLDTRGNKPGVNAQFSIHEERLAFVPREQLDEMDYPTIYTKPHPSTMRVLRSHTDPISLYNCHLPERLHE